MKPSQHHCRTLVVEDSPTSLGALVKLLVIRGFDVGFSGTVAGALEKLAALQPDCVLLDLMLPDGNGLTILRQIRSEGRDVRVAVVTGVEDPHMLADVLQLSPDAIFQKPVDVEQLVSWLRAA